MREKLGRARVALSDDVWSMLFETQTPDSFSSLQEKRNKPFQVLFLLLLSMIPEAHKPVFMGFCIPIARWPLGMNPEHPRMR